MKLKVYHYDKCGTCRKARKYLSEKGVEANWIPIREKPPTIGELKSMLKNYQGDLKRLFNTSGQDYRQLNMKERWPGLSEADALKLLAGNGNLVKRPFALAVKGEVGCVGFKEEEWNTLLTRI